MNTKMLVRSLFAGALGLLSAPLVSAVNRVVDFNVPLYAGAGTSVPVYVSAATDAGGGEQVGFLHWDYSTNNGGSWTPINYDYNLGASVSRSTSIIAGSAGSTIRLRARVAFRDGSAGDVDYAGGAIDWSGTWDNWGSPPTKEVSIPVVEVTNFSASNVAANNSSSLASILDGFANSDTPRVLQFPSGVIEFDTNGYLAGMTNIRNLTLIGHSGGTTLKWNVTGDAHHFFLLDQDCRNIRFENLTFTSWLEDDSSSRDPGMGQNGTSWRGRQTDGNYIKIFGKHVTVNGCTFKYAPGYALKVDDWNADTADDDIAITSNSFFDNMGDPIHVHTGQNIWIVGNYINRCGDDGIAVVADEFNGTTNVRKADRVYIWWNTILNSGWRGIAVITADNVDMRHNIITNTGGHGIEITSIIYEHSQSYSYPASWPTGFLLHDGTYGSTVDAYSQNIENSITGYGSPTQAKDGNYYSRDQVHIEWHP